MGKAKDIILKPISAKDAIALIKRVHYSGKVVQNSNIHIGVFYQGKLEGAMQFGSSLDKRKIMGLVEGTGWNEFIELNRMAFTDALPRNSESRAIGIAMKILRQHAPHIKWVISFADACQCGDGTIYRASGFVLTGIRENKELWLCPDGVVRHRMNFKTARSTVIQRKVRSQLRSQSDDASSLLKKWGASQIKGHQIQYIYFIDPSARSRLTVPEIPFERIKEMGASMYKGRAIVKGSQQANADNGGSLPTRSLQSSKASSSSEINSVGL